MRLRLIQKCRVFLFDLLYINAPLLRLLLPQGLRFIRTLEESPGCPLVQKELYYKKKGKSSGFFKDVGERV